MKAIRIGDETSPVKLTLEPARFLNQADRPPHAGHLRVHNDGSFQSITLDAADLEILAMACTVLAAEINQGEDE
jgi:hypothetical protein